MRCRELGVAAYLTKPVRQSILLDAILAVLARPVPGAAPTLVTRHSLREAQDPEHATRPKDSADDPLLTADGRRPASPGRSRRPRGRSGRCACSSQRTTASTSS